MEEKIGAGGKLQKFDSQDGRYKQNSASTAESLIDTYSDSPERDKKAMMESGQLVRKKNGYIELPKKEYAKLCSAVRTRYADKIPAKGQILFGNYYYHFKYDKKQERIVYTFKLRINGNERKINNLFKEFDNE